jgi:aspartyl-tRNA(Asn)/glutamyl-tRNA(Gln) amidotransferase subunit A
MSDICFMPLVEQARLLASGALSAVEVTEAYLARITTQDGALRAWVSVDAEDARQQAAQADARRAAGHDLGPLLGLPIGVKDLIDLAGHPTAAGAAHLRGNIAAKDAPVVAALRRAGAVVLGKTATAEYAVGGTVAESPRNPWNRDCDAGASSSGSAVAVAAGMCAAALGSETAGSIRVPAAWCGVAGLVPTQALVSRRGVLPLSQTMDCIGPMARSVADCALLLQGMLTDDPEDRATPGFRLPDLTRQMEKSLRLGIPRHIFEDDPELDTEVRAAFASSLQALRDLGCILTEVVLDGYATWADAARAISWPEETANHGAELRAHPDRFSAVTRSRLTAGLGFTAPEHILAHRTRQAAIASLRATFQSVDLLVLPTTKAPAQAFGYEHLPGARDLSYTRAFNLTGTPSLTLCNGFSTAGLPLSVQVIGRSFEDDQVLALGVALERLRPVGPEAFSLLAT